MEHAMDPHECILWDERRNADGYGIFWCKKTKKTLFAHRRSFEDTYGRIPEGMCVLHRCDTPCCITPEHLFLGTKGDNARDMVAKGRQWQQRKTHCPQGHPYAGQNLYTHKNGVGKRRRCRKCVLTKNLIRYHKNKRTKGRNTA